MPLDGLEAHVSTPARIAVGLPVYNAERYLRGAIESHLGQTFGDFDLIISDNASTDATEEICRQYAAKDARIQYHRADRNRGLSWNHARCFDLARSDLFRWSAGDDAPSPTLLEEAESILARNPAVVLVVPHTKNVDGDGRELGELPRTLDLRTPDPVERATAVLTRGYQMIFPQGLMRRSALLATSRRWTYFGWDFILLFELALQGEFALTSTSWLTRRLHDRQASRVQRDARAGVRQVEPTFRTGLLLPHWRWEWERLRATFAAAPLTPTQKARIAALVARHAWWSRRALLDDVSASVRRTFGREKELRL